MVFRAIFKTLSFGAFAGLAVYEAPKVFPTMFSRSESNFKRKWFHSYETVKRNLFSATSVSASADSSDFDVKSWNWDWDGMCKEHDGSNSDENRRSKYTRHLLFIRHGQYHYADDDVDCHLTDLGAKQLEFTGVRLKQLRFPYKKLFYSTMTRAIESADIILTHLPGVPAEPSEWLCEGAPYPPEPSLRHYQPTLKQLSDDNRRIESAFTKFVRRADHLQTEDTYEVFVCHANVIRYFVCRALQLPPEAWLRFSLDHGSITWIAVRPDGCVSLRWLGNSGHIPPNDLSIT